jgi:hypothetical protein
VTSELQSASDTQAVRVFNTGHKTLEHGLERLRQLEEHLHEAALEQIRAARRALDTEWPALEADGYADGSLKDSVDAIADILSKETFYNELPALATASAQVHKAHADRVAEAAEERRAAYTATLEQLESTEGWADLDAGLQDEIAAPLRRRAGSEPDGVPLAMLRENTLACSGLLKIAIERVHRSVPGDEPVFVSVSKLLHGPITSEEQLDSALAQLKEQCLKSIADGTAVILI